MNLIKNEWLRKLTPSSQHPRVRYQAIYLSTRPIELPMGVNIETKGDEIQVDKENERLSITELLFLPKSV